MKKNRKTRSLELNKKSISKLNEETVKGGMLKSSVSNCYCHSDLCETKIGCQGEKTLQEGQDWKL